MSAAELAAMDSYAQARRVGIGAELAKDAAGARILSLIDGGPAQLAGLHTGDRLAAIDGASLDAAALLDISGRLQGAAGSKVLLRVLREGAAPWSVVLVRASVATPSVRSAAIGHVGYVRIYSFANDTAPALRKALTGFAADAAIHGLVLDLRDNPGGLVDAAQAVCSAFLGSGKILSMRPRRAEDTVTLSGDGTALATGLPLVVLINEATASASEIVAGALQDRRRGVIVGVRSFGKGSVQTVLPLGEGEGALRLTTARYYTPGGRSIQGSGIDPDIVAWPSRAHAASAISREADLGRVLAGQGGVKLDVQRRDLAVIARGIAPLPPPGWQAADGEPQGDYPLHAGIEVIDALAAAPAAGKP
jgi:carboxyl-terminal processing protease